MRSALSLPHSKITFFASTLHTPITSVKFNQVWWQFLEWLHELCFYHHKTQTVSLCNIYEQLKHLLSLGECHPNIFEWHEFHLQLDMEIDTQRLPLHNLHKYFFGFNNLSYCFIIVSRVHDSRLLFPSL